MAYMEASLVFFFFQRMGGWTVGWRDGRIDSKTIWKDYTKIVTIVISERLEYVCFNFFLFLLNF